MTEILSDRAREFFLGLEEFSSPNLSPGRKGSIPDTVIFGFTNDRSFHENFMDKSYGKAPHYVILRDGKVRNYIEVTDSSRIFTTSAVSDSKKYYGKADGLVSCRAVNVAQYSVCVLFEGDRPTVEQMLAAAALLRLISLKFIRIYRKKLPLDENHIISATVLPSEYNFDIDIRTIIELCRKKPI